MSVIEQIGAWIDAESRVEKLSIFRGNDWWQLSAEEGKVFQIGLKDMPRLVAVYQVYQAAKGIAHNDFWGTPLCEEARREFGLQEDRMADAGDFRRMAVRFGVPIRKALGIYFKMEWWTIRNEMHFDDEKE